MSSAMYKIKAGETRSAFQYGDRQVYNDVLVRLGERESEIMEKSRRIKALERRLAVYAVLLQIATLRIEQLSNSKR